EAGCCSRDRRDRSGRSGHRSPPCAAADTWRRSRGLMRFLGDDHGVYKAWTRLNARAAVPHVRFHDLRHTAASLVLLRGIHPKIVSEMLRHSTVAITLDVYSHVTPTMQREAADVMDATGKLTQRLKASHP